MFIINSAFCQEHFNVGRSIQRMGKGAPKLSQVWNGKKLQGLYDLRHSCCFERSAVQDSVLHLS